MADRKQASPTRGAKIKTTPTWQKAFLAVLAEHGNVNEACRKAKVTRAVVYTRRKKDPELQALWDEALEMSCDELEKEARSRALEGWEEPVYQGGQMVGTVRRFSDRLMIILLQAHRSRKFSEAGRAAKHMPAGAAGSIQIYLPSNTRRNGEGNGDDNGD